MTSLQASIEKLVDTEIVQFVAVRDVEQNIVAVSGVLPANQAQQVDSGLHPNDRQVVRRELRFSDLPVGYIEFGYSLSPIVSAQEKEARRNVVATALSIIALTIVFITIVVYLTRSLRQLSESVRLARKGDLAVKFAISESGELSDIANAFDDVLSKLRTAKLEREDLLVDLARQKVMLSTTQTIAQMGYWKLDLNSNKVFISKECNAIFGYAGNLQEFDFKQLLDIVHKDDIRQVSQQFEHSARENGGEFKYRIVLSDGTVRTLFCKMELLKHKLRKPGVLLGIVQDVTEHHNIAQAQKESERWFRQLAESVNEVFWICSLNWQKILYLNSAYEQIWGEGVNEALNRELAWLELIHPDDKEDVAQCLPGQISDIGSVIEFPDFRIINQNDGMVRWIKAKAYPVRNDTNKIILIAGVAEDITEQRNVEKELRESEARLLSAQSIANIGNIEWDINGKVGCWATEVYRMFAISAEAYLPTYESFISLVHKDDRQYVRKMIQNCYINVESSEFEFKIKTNSEEIRWIYAILRLENDKNGMPRRISGILQNISARKISEERAKLLQLQLQQSQKMEAIGQLTGGIAHDFNNILAAIMGYTGLALDRCMDGDNVRLKEYLEEVYHAGERATDLITQMMTFSRTSINEPQKLSIIPLVNEVCKMLGSILPSSIQVRTQFDDNLPNILIDPVQLQQVIMNICINARDAMAGKGELLIAVKSIKFTTANINTDPNQSDIYNQIISCESCHEIIKDEDYLKLSISDNGQGIESSDWLHIFEPFFTTKDVGKGTGMGLSMVHGIVHEHNGHILIDSSVGKGTTFKILFPCMTSDAKSISPKVRAERVIKPLANPANILVVDDEESMARYIATVFEKSGHHVNVFTSSKEALQSYRSNPDFYDLLVTDQTMPGLTGAELSKAILAHNAEFPIMLCTGYSESLNEDQAIQIGIKKYLYKPVETAILLGVANDLLDVVVCHAD